MTTTESGPAARHDPVYDEIFDSAEFKDLRRRYQKFVFPASVFFLGWYGLYVLASNYAHGFMSHTLVGNINVALVWGLLQFVTTFLIAYLYARYSSTHIDPAARRLEKKYDDHMRGGL